MLRTPAAAALAGHARDTRREAQAPRARPRSLFVALATVGTLALVPLMAPTVAHAAPAAPKTKAPAKQADSGKTGSTSSSKSGSKSGNKSSKTPARTPGNKSISLDDDFLVEGNLEKPSAFYVFRRSATDYDWARMDAVFTPLVLESVQDPLF